MAALLLLTGLVTSAMADCSSYISNEELTDYLTTKASSEPRLTSVYSIGLSELKWDIPVLELSAAESTEQVPNVKFIGGIHGDEPIGTQVLISFIEYLIEAYGREERFVTWLLNNTRIHILPRLNMDGFDLAAEGECNMGPGRENAAGYDINRAFSPKGDFVPEADAVKSWLRSDVFVLSASMYGGELVAVYPPDNTEEYGGLNTTSDDDVFKHLASVYARNHHSMSKENGCNENNKFNNGTINGADWYPVKGSMQDYNYKYGTMELTLEIDCCKYPPSDQICTTWIQNKLALLKLAAESCRGVRGRVMTASGNPISGATVSILGRNMTVRTNEQGYYFRILLPGRYFIKVESAGMKTFIKEFTVPISDTAFLNWETVNVQLEVDSDKYPSNNENPPKEQTISTIIYDEGGLDPYNTTTYDDTYLSSTDGSHVRVGLITGAASIIHQNNLYSVSIVILCKYLIVYILNRSLYTNCMIIL